MARLLTISLCVLLTVSGCTQTASISDAEFNQRMGEINDDIANLQGNVEQAENDPAIIEAYAQIRFLEQELKARPDSTKEDILRELDKLWVAY